MNRKSSQCIVTRSLQMGSAGKGVMGVHSAGEVWSTTALLLLCKEGTMNLNRVVVLPDGSFNLAVVI